MLPAYSFPMPPTTCHCFVYFMADGACFRNNIAWVPVFRDCKDIKLRFFDARAMLMGTMDGKAFRGFEFFVTDLTLVFKNRLVFVTMFAHILFPCDTRFEDSSSHVFPFFEILETQ